MFEERRPTHRARELRNMATLAERRLWTALSRRQLSGAEFCRQMPIGPYFADFLCRAHKLVVEIDDSSHDLRRREDMARTAYLEGAGYRVIRIPDADVRDRLDAVLQAIGAVLAARGPTPPLRGCPSRPAGGEKAKATKATTLVAFAATPSLEMPRAVH